MTNPGSKEQKGDITDAVRPIPYNYTCFADG